MRADTPTIIEDCITRLSCNKPELDQNLAELRAKFAQEEDNSFVSVPDFIDEVLAHINYLYCELAEREVSYEGLLQELAEATLPDDIEYIQVRIRPSITAIVAMKRRILIWDGIVEKLCEADDANRYFTNVVDLCHHELIDSDPMKEWWLAEERKLAGAVYVPVKGELSGRI